jgi:hypothetical protein
MWLEKREPWRDEVENRCMSAGLVTLSDHITRAKPIDGPGVCGLNQPLRVTGLSEGAIALKPAATLVCQMVPTLDQWLLEKVQPAAQHWFGAAVTDMKIGSYACRAQNNQRSNKSSEHAYGNALDIFSFTLADGRLITIAQGWKGESRDQAFLREVFTEACGLFNTVLGPGADAFHYDHFHLDLARHNANFSRRICKPRPETFEKPLISK